MAAAGEEVNKVWNLRIEHTILERMTREKHSGHTSTHFFIPQTSKHRDNPLLFIPGLVVVVVVGGGREEEEMVEEEMVVGVGGCSLK